MKNIAGSSLERIAVKAVARAGGAVLTGLLRTTRSELIQGAELEARIVRTGMPALFLLWHGRLLIAAHHYRHHGFGTLITRNRDGDYISWAVERWGYTVLRGSSSRGGASAVRSIVALLRSGRSVALTPDGPRGPRQKMKVGPLRAAQLAGVPLVPVSAGATNAWYFGSWDRFLVPRPFTWTPLALGEPVSVPPGADEEELAAIGLRIEASLNELTRSVDEAARERRR